MNSVNALPSRNRGFRKYFMGIVLQSSYKSFTRNGQCGEVCKQLSKTNSREK